MMTQDNHRRNIELFERTIGVLGSAGSIAGMIKAIGEWNGRFADYCSVIVFVIIVVISIWLFLSKPISKWRKRKSLARKLSDAILQLRLNDSSLQRLSAAILKNKQFEGINITIDIFSSILEQSLLTDFKGVGPPAKLAKNTHLIDALASMILKIYSLEGLTETDVNRVASAIIGDAVCFDDAQKIIKDIPLIEWTTGKVNNKDTHKGKFVQEAVANNILIWRPYKFGNKYFTVHFDVENFLFANTVIALKLDMIKEALERFEGVSIDTVVCIQQNPVTEINHMISELAKYKKAKFLAFPIQKKDRDDEWERRIREFCGSGKSTLIVEPLNIDGKILDVAYNILRDCGSTVNGVLILFQEQSFNGDMLENVDKIREKTRKDDIRGQVILNLKPN